MAAVGGDMLYMTLPLGADVVDIMEPLVEAGAGMVMTKGDCDGIE